MFFCGPVSHLRESTISDLESLSNFQVKEKKEKISHWLLSMFIRRIFFSLTVNKFGIRQSSSGHYACTVRTMSNIVKL